MTSQPVTITNYTLDLRPWIAVGGLTSGRKSGGGYDQWTEERSIDKAKCFQKPWSALQAQH